jgi:hypothetical protein
VGRKEVFKSCNNGADQLPPASGPQLPLDEAAEKQRATRVGEQFGQITPSLVQYTTDVLVPGSLAQAGPGSARPQPGHRERADRHRSKDRQ